MIFFQPTYVYQTAPSCTLDPSPYPPPPPLFALVTSQAYFHYSNAAYAAECWNDTVQRSTTYTRTYLTVHCVSAFCALNEASKLKLNFVGYAKMNILSTVLLCVIILLIKKPNMFYYTDLGFCLEIPMKSSVALAFSIFSRTAQERY
jgi:hypothetical protein